MGNIPILISLGRPDLKTVIFGTSVQRHAWHCGARAATTGSVHSGRTRSARRWPGVNPGRCGLARRALRPPRQIPSGRTAGRNPLITASGLGAPAPWCRPVHALAMPPGHPPIARRWDDARRHERPIPDPGLRTGAGFLVSACAPCDWPGAWPRTWPSRLGAATIPPNHLRGLRRCRCSR